MEVQIESSTQQRNGTQRHDDESREDGSVHPAGSTLEQQPLLTESDDEKGLQALPGSVGAFLGFASQHDPHTVG